MSRDHLDMVKRSLEAFADGRMTRGELDDIVDIGLRDGQLDADERRVLGQLVARLNSRELEAGIRDRLVRLQRDHGLELPA